MWFESVSINFLGSAIIFSIVVSSSVLTPLAVFATLSSPLRWAAPPLAALPLMAFAFLPRAYLDAETLTVPAFISLSGVACLLVADRKPALVRSHRRLWGFTIGIIIFLLGPLNLMFELSPQPSSPVTLTLIVGLGVAQMLVSFLLGIALPLSIMVIVVSDWRRRGLRLR